MSGRCGQRVAAALLAFALVACGTTEPAKLRFGLAEAPEGRTILWPPAPDVPRYAYAGQLVGEQNFRRDEPGSGETLKTVWYWIAGILAGDVKPLVLQRPQSGVVDELGGRIYVTDVSRAAVFVFDEKLGELQVWERSEGLRSFASPVGIALGGEGDVWVADADLAMVARLDRNGEPIAAVGRGVLKRPTGVAYDRTRKLLYVSDTHAHDIKVFDADGRLVRILGVRGEGPSEFNFPTYLTLSEGELYVTDTMNNRIQIIDTETGAQLRDIGKRGLFVGNLVRPKGVAVDSEANVYVVESYYDHLLVFNSRGEFLMPIGGLGQNTGKFYLPSGVWTDSRNRVFVADTFNGRVVVFQFLGGDLEPAQ